MRFWNKVRLKPALTVLFLVSMGQIASAQSNSNELYWYVDGHKQTWDWMPDKFAVQVPTDAESQPLTTSFLSKKAPVTSATEKFIEFEFTAIMPASSKQNHINEILNTYHTDEVLPVLYAKGTFAPVYIDDQVMVRFKNASISVAEVNEFMQKYDLTLQNKEVWNMPQSGKQVFIFRMNSNTLNYTAGHLAANLFEDEKPLISSAQPNRLNLVEVDGEMVDPSSNPAFYKSWHLDNNGQQLFCSAKSGTNDADVKVKDTWNLGYTGQGVTVGVIDIGGFDYNHPGLQGQLMDGWDCINNRSYNGSNFFFSDANQGHGMGVTGIIVASSSNGATGVAPGARVAPLLISGSEASIVLALQKALEMNLDIVNMSFAIGYSEAVKQQVQNLVNLGRKKFGTALGTIVIASHGNNGSDDAISPQWPAAYDEVLSVGASTPDDRYKTNSDPWNVGSTWATNYGDLVDLNAPGVCIYTTDIAGSAGYSSTDYGGLQKTSAAAPIVAGVAALLLSKNNSMTWEEVRTTLLNSADKVHSNEYNYSHDAAKVGHSREMGYGRVNALKALGEVAVGVTSEPTIALGTDIRVVNPIQNNQLEIFYPGAQLEQDLVVGVFDMNGSLIRQQLLGRHEEFVSIDVFDITPGMYFARFMYREDELIQTVKFVKLW
jgi:subtilisin family serine protease